MGTLRAPVKLGLLLPLVAMLIVSGCSQYRGGSLPEFRDLQVNPNPELPGTFVYVTSRSERGQVKEECANVTAASGGSRKTLTCHPYSASTAWLEDGSLAVISLDTDYSSDGIRTTERIRTYDSMSGEELRTQSREVTGSQKYAPPLAGMVGLSTVCDSTVKLRDSRPGSHRDVVEYSSPAAYAVEGRYSADQTRAAGIDSDRNLLIFDLSSRKHRAARYIDE